MQNSEITRAGLPFSPEIESPQNSHTRNLKMQSQYPAKITQQPSFEWYIIELGKVGIAFP